LSAETEKLFKRLLKEMRPLFKEHGFRAVSQNFVFESNECWVIFNFQKSRRSDSEETTFYVNVAASSKTWLGFEGKPTDKVPPYYACDWQWRVEHFALDKTIKSWTLRDEASFQATLSYLQKLFEKFVLPATKSMMTNAELLEHTGGFEYPQLKTRAVILASTDQIDTLRLTVATLIEKFGGTVADGIQEHLRLMRSKYPDVMRQIEVSGNQS
jgi:Domain of unknown function (DUF4304)